jgi:predicted transcriptional regulator
MAITIRLSEEQDKALKAIADHLGISKNSAARIAIELFTNQESQRLKIREAFALVNKRDAKLLERL